VHQLEESVRGAVGRLRGLVVNLRPTTIDQHGLIPALTGYLQDVVAGWGLETSLSADLSNEPPVPVAITLFRICQEALTNTHKHAQASRVEITLHSKDGGTLVRVIDDGIGLPFPASDDPYRHFGLLEMRERAEIAGGWWSVTSTPGSGTTVQFWLPTAPTQDPPQNSPQGIT
jgi:signal transduction histidine kinase